MGGRGKEWKGGNSRDLKSQMFKELRCATKISCTALNLHVITTIFADIKDESVIG
jgi:hypothetical protein